MIRNVLGEIRRIPGVGRATLCSTERSLRIWIDPAKLVGYGLTADDVNKAIARAERAGRLGQHRRRAATAGQRISALVLVKGQLVVAGRVRHHHPARQRRRLDGAAARRRAHRGRRPQLPVQHAPERQADRRPLACCCRRPATRWRPRARSRTKMKELSRFFPANIAYEIPYDITPVVEASIKKVLTTLVEAVVLVFVVMFLFLQNIRYTIIPTIVVPVALLGACAALLLARLFDQRADDVRHGAGGRHPRRRRHRRGRERRAHHDARKACRRGRRRARRWGRSPAPSSASRWC